MWLWSLVQNNRMTHLVPGPFSRGCLNFFWVLAKMVKMDLRRNDLNFFASSPQHEPRERPHLRGKDGGGD